MSCRILIVEDEIFVASEIEQIVAEMGHDPIGIAADKKSALRFAGETDVALVDLNLRDGPTGIEIGRILAQTHGASVIFLTANPAQLGDGVPGTIGVVSKPVAEKDLRDVVDYANARRAEAAAQPPRRLKLFDWSEGPAITT
jgi:CheY-like chemotaxis protein